MKDRNGWTWQRISDLEAEVRREEEAVRAKKRLVNQLCASVGAVPVYGAQEFEPPVRDLAPGVSVFGVLPLALCTKRVLEQRLRYELGPAAVEDVLATLLRGGFDFALGNGLERRELLRRVAEALSRNRNWFRRTRDGKWELKR